jgi:hypothetical protein
LDIFIYYIPNVLSHDTEDFANLIWFSGSLHCCFLTLCQYSLKLMMSQRMSATLFVENVDYVTMKTLCTKNHHTIYLFWFVRLFYSLSNFSAIRRLSPLPVTGLQI